MASRFHLDPPGCQHGIIHGLNVGWLRSRASWDYRGCSTATMEGNEFPNFGIVLSDRPDTAWRTASIRSDVLDFQGSLEALVSLIISQH